MHSILDWSLSIYLAFPSTNSWCRIFKDWIHAFNDYLDAALVRKTDKVFRMHITFIKRVLQPDESVCVCVCICMVQLPNFNATWIRNEWFYFLYRPFEFFHRHCPHRHRRHHRRSLMVSSIISLWLPIPFAVFSEWNSKMAAKQ